MTQEIIIWSFLRTTVDLAAEMQDWPEFIASEGFSVDVKDKITGETVTIRYIDDWEEEHFTIK